MKTYRVRRLTSNDAIGNDKLMKISGFTVIRNAVKMGYPIKESLSSLLPLVDELVVGVGQSDDNTKELILALNEPKIKIFDSFWDLENTSGGLILSEKTNEALERCKNDWCFYLQADEVLHEEDYLSIKKSLRKAQTNKDIDGLLFDYVHFYGSYQTVAKSRKWYRKEIRLVKKSSGAQSYKDAQGFRVAEKQKLKVIPAHARVFHYGWVKPPELMGQKAQMLDYWWHGEKKNKDNKPFVYDNQYGLRRFKQTHPKVMTELVSQQDWHFQHKRTLKDWRLKDLRYLSSDWIESLFNYRIGEYKPYRILKS